MRPAEKILMIPRNHLPLIRALSVSRKSIDSTARALRKHYNEARHNFRGDDLDKCVEKSPELLEDSAIPHFDRTKTPVLLGGVLGDWHEANKCSLKADTFWSIVRRWHCEGEGAEVDDAMEECHSEIGELGVAL